jgi:hypothetical protein
METDALRCARKPGKKPALGVALKVKRYINI